MPNWCNNHIVISGEKSDMKPIYDFFKDNHNHRINHNLAVMSSLVPRDEEYKAIEDSGEYLLSPMVNFYGTKWDFDLNEANIGDITEECITLSPSTAWSPPSEFCRRLTAKHKVQITLNFEECGIGFVGQEEFKDGEMTGQVMYDNYAEGMYYLDNDVFWDSTALNDIEYMLEEEPEITFEELHERLYSFITNESDIATLKEIYEEQVEFNKN
jgi:hypothetical protein